MSETKKIPTKLIIGGLGIVAVLAVLYFFVFSGDSVDTNLSLESTSSTDSVDSEDGDISIPDTDSIVRQLNDLRRLRISDDLFNSPTFLSLKDFSITINPHPIGRDNPFIPSTYVPSGASIIPRANPAIPQSTDGAAETNTTDNTATSSEDSETTAEATTTAATSSDELETTGN
ncbi:MAG: hypothetical protein WD552_02775 [Candidatus Paceibacterota bacterium]